MTEDEWFMTEAVTEAKAALAKGDVPIGCIVVRDGGIVARAHWSWEPQHDLLAHPEMVALRSVDARGGTLYTTLEPCVMCMGAAMSSFVSRVVFALPSPSDGGGALPELYSKRLPACGRPWSIPEVVGGIGQVASRQLVDAFLASASPGPLTDWARSLVQPNSPDGAGPERT